VAVALVAAFVLLRATVFAPVRVPVRVAPVERGRVEETVTNSRAGTVKARRRAHLSPEVGGKVIALPQREGSRVRAGAVLLRIDDAIPRAQLEVAERELAASQAQREQACLEAERAERERERNARLALEGIVSGEVLDRVASAAQTAQAACKAASAGAARAGAAVQLARVEIGKLVLAAPFDGIVAEVSIEEGEWTMPSPPGLPIPPVIDLIDLGSLYIGAPMDEVDSARIAAGQPARVTVDSHPGRSFAGTVVRVAPYVLDVEAQNRTVDVEVDLADGELTSRLLPGTSADVEIILEVRENVVRVPTTALLEGGRVLVVDSERLAERRVETGIRNWNFTEIREGLTERDRIVTSLDRPEVKAGALVSVESTAER
jgi:HlyD family secretion protein